MPVGGCVPPVAEGLSSLDQFLKPSDGFSAVVGLTELFVAVLVTGISLANSGVPVGAFLRSHDGRFLVLASANGGLALLGALWTWGELPLGPPSWAVPNLPVLSLTLLVTLLLLATTLWPRHV
jgi:hypothetical protein